MKSVAMLLCKGAEEIRAFAESPEARHFTPDWLERIAARLEAASLLPSESIDREVQSIARLFLDSGPSWSEAPPSVGVAVDALHRARAQADRN
jgi:hypothetical protein